MPKAAVSDSEPHPAPAYYIMTSYGCTVSFEEKEVITFLSAKLVLLQSYVTSKLSTHWRKFNHIV